MLHILPTMYQPLSPEEFVGHAAKLALQIKRCVEDARKHDNQPIKVMLNGKPGIGKSALAKYLFHILGCDIKWGVKKYNGTSVKMETVEDIARDLNYRDLYGNYRGIWVEEADVIPAVAQIRFLTLLDDLPSACAVVCTSNCEIEEFKQRFQTRFKIYEVEAPKPHEVEILLKKFLTDQRAITNISTFACGNVRAALLDAERAIQALPVAA